MAFRLKLVPTHTNIDFFKWQWITFGASVLAVVISLLSVAVLGLNFGIDFKGGTTIRTESTQAVDVGEYRAALDTLGLGDVSITQVFDPTFAADQHVAMVRIAPQEGSEAVTPEVIAEVETALQAVDPAITFPSVESVGPKVSQELIWKALLSILAGSAGIWIYVWLRFEWQFA
ncbi:MAG TPA: protein translocase subunit SecF, partial [Gemmobacter sp.]|nr:protein translocase subunit SecF [Gemmobacter sp.]